MISGNGKRFVFTEEAVLQIRPARPDDARHVCEVLRRSIAELCLADHDGCDDILLPWLANKTPENVGKWTEVSHQLVVVAETGDNIIAGVGLASHEGTILLNYVSPDFRFQGVSKAIIRYLESYLLRRGTDVVRLVSSETARGFYLAQGYVLSGEPQVWRGEKLSYPMEKQLTG